VKTTKTRQKIKLTITRPDGRTSNASIIDESLTPLMMAAAEELIYVMCNNARPPAASGRRVVTAQELARAAEEAEGDSDARRPRDEHRDGEEIPSAAGAARPGTA
jgi:hypothetical protein